MERSRLINKWLGDAQMSRATDAEKEKFIFILQSLTDIELMKPYLLLESDEGKSLGELSKRYKITKAQVRHQIKCAKNSHT